MSIHPHIAALIQAEPNPPCVSLILPLAHTMPAKAHNKTNLMQLHKETQKELKQHPASVQQALDQRLQRLIDQFDDAHATADGYGFFVTQQAENMIPFSGAPNALATVGAYFAVTELMYSLQIPNPVWILLLGRDRARLLRSTEGRLTEVITPLTDAQGQSLQGFPLTDISLTDTVREAVGTGDRGDIYRIEEIKRFFHLVDAELAKKVQTEPLPVLLYATPEYSTLYHQVTKHKQLILASAEHDFIKNSGEQLSHDITRLLKTRAAQIEKQLLEDFSEAIGTNRQASGIMYTWEMIQAGRVRILLVERELQAYGRVTPGNPPHLDRMETTQLYPSDRISDIFINETIRHGGSVHVVTQTALASCEGVGAILRY